MTNNQILISRQFFTCKCCGKRFPKTSPPITMYCSQECKRVANLNHAKKRYYQKKKTVLAYGKEWRRRNPEKVKEYRKNQGKRPRKYNVRYYYGIPIELYKKLTKKCMINGCNFSITIDLHHINRDKQNNNPSNLIGLCPSHHQLIHRLNYKLIHKSYGWELVL